MTMFSQAAIPWMENVAHYACRLDAEGRVLGCNQRLMRALGTDAAALEGSDFAAAVGTVEQQPQLQSAIRGNRSGQVLPGEFLESTLPAGSGPVPQHVRWFISPFEYGEGERGFLALGWDGTSQLQMERFLLRLARVVDLTAEPVVIANERGVAEYVNPAFTAAAGYPPGEIIGRSLSGIVAVPEDPTVVHKAIATFHQGEGWEGSLRLRRKDGSPMSVQARVFPVRDASKRTTHFIAIAHDLSRQQSLERQVEELQRMESLATLANGLAHRFNNILAAISGQTELLLMSTSDEAVRQRAQRIFDAAMKGKEVVEQLTVFGRKNEPRPRPADLVPVVRNAVNFIRAAQPRAVKVVDHLPPESRAAMVNTSEIHQVLLNLLTNALQAIGDRPGTIDISLREVDRQLAPEGRPVPCVQIDVQDDGPGIPSEIRRRIFEPFFTTRSLANASGMGLATSRAIIARHGGIVDCESEEGHGARFTIILPVLPDQSVPQILQPRTTGGSILLVDTAGYALETGKRQLEALHYDVVALANYEAAIEALRDPSVHVGLLLTCLKLSRRSGLDLVREARKLRPSLPVILSPNLSDEVDIHEARAAGVDQVLRKPIPMDQLSSVMHELMEDLGPRS